MIHRLLQEQLQTHLGDCQYIPENLAPLFAAISDSYSQMEQEIEIPRTQNGRNAADILANAGTEMGLLLQKLEEVVFSIDLVGGELIQMSAACEKIYGLPASAFYSNMNLWFEMVVPEDRHIIEANYAIMHRGEPFVNTYRIRDAHGSIKWLETKLFPTLNPDGTPSRLDGITLDITSWKEAELELLNSGTEYRKLFDLNPLPMWIREDGSFKFLHVNCAAIEHYGFSNEEFMSMTLLDIRPQHERDMFVQLENSSPEIGQRAGIWTHTKKNGENIVVDIVSSPITYEGKKARLVLARDITQSLAAEKALREAEQNLRTILENTETAYILMDKDCRIISYNHVAAEMAPAAVKEPLYQGVYYPDLMPKNRQEAIIGKLQSVLHTGKKMAYEIKNFLTDETVWFDVSINPIMNDDHVAIGIMLAFTDITKRKLTELRLEQSNERFRCAANATNDAIWEWDFDSGTVQWGDGYEKLFGFGKEQYDGSIHHSTTRIHPEDSDRVISSIQQRAASSDKSLWQAEYRYFKAGGEIAYVYDRGYIIYDSKDKAVRMVGAMQDITAKKQAELERDKITADLLQRNKELEQFTYIVSHNLRAPLANIKGLASILAEGTLGKSDRESMLAMLLVSANSLDDVVMDLNNILRVGNISEKKETVLLPQLVEEIRTSLNHIIQTEKVQINCSFPVGELFTIKSYLHSILYNLVSNSIKYRRPEVCPVVTLTSICNEEEATISVSDNGLGIDLSRNHDKVFGLYKRFHPDIEGKGMGLFMVKTQIEALGGTVGVESVPNSGTTFTITLPLHLQKKYA